VPLLLHLSDTHFGTEQPPVVEALEALVRARRPDLAVHSGDITQRAKPAEFAAAQAFCRRLAVPQLLALPGNHDIPLFDLATRALRPYARHLAAFGPRLEPLVDTPEFLVLGVNTTRPWRHKHGEVSPAQVEQVALRLRRAARSQLRVVVTHQPAAVARPEDAKDRLRGGEAALRAWAAAGADLVLGGHIHLPYVLEWPGPRRAWVVQAGTAVSSRVRHGTCNSVNLVEWRAPRGRDPRRCLVERWDYDAGVGAFRLAADRALRLD
jgi:3',5'-cyclic AMP phosphodiesterase CpdA